VVAECQAAWLAAKEPGALSTTALEACIAAKVLVEALRKASNAVGKEPTRDSLQKALATLGRVDVGGFVMNFRNGFNHGGIFVDIAVIRRNGEVRTS
jgi:branched-chain amino acid transport system substrate-binding protein